MERFELAEHIAGCNIYEDNTDGSKNGYIDGEWFDNIFIEGNIVCVVGVETYCYTNGSISNATISS